MFLKYILPAILTIVLVLIMRGIAVDNVGKKVIPRWAVIVVFIVAFIPILNWVAFIAGLILAFSLSSLYDLKEPTTKLGKWLRD